MSIDHTDPLSNNMGGNGQQCVSNMQFLCSDCNSQKVSDLALIMFSTLSSCMVDLALLFGWQSNITHEDLDWRDEQWKEATLAMKKQNDDCTDVYTTVLNPGATRFHRVNKLKFVAAVRAAVASKKSSDYNKCLGFFHHGSVVRI